MTIEGVLYASLILWCRTHHMGMGGKLLTVIHNIVCIWAHLTVRNWVKF